MTIGELFRKTNAAWLTALFLMWYIFTVTIYLLPSLPGQAFIAEHDKELHSLYYFGSALFVMATYKNVILKLSLLGFLCLMTYFIEVIQGLAGTRTQDILDANAGMQGILLAIVAVLIQETCRLLRKL